MTTRRTLRGNKQAKTTESRLPHQYAALSYFSRQNGSGIYLEYNEPSITNNVTREKKKQNCKLYGRLHTMFFFAFLHFNVHDMNYHQAKLPKVGFHRPFSILCLHYSPYALADELHFLRTVI